MFAVMFEAHPQPSRRDTAPASRVTAERGNQVFMREYRTELTHAR
jgi:hypothetical protein